MIFTFTSLKNQKNKINENKPTIDFGECETLLRKEYGLELDQELYIKKIDIIQEETNAKKVQYDFYCKHSDRKLEKLDLSICMNSTIAIHIPITGDANKYNISSEYYHDICYTQLLKMGQI